MNWLRGYGSTRAAPDQHDSVTEPMILSCPPPLALSEVCSVLLLILNSERFADLAPAAVFAILLDEGRYHGSARTMYRFLAAENQSGERRKQRAHHDLSNRLVLNSKPPLGNFVSLSAGFLAAGVGK